MKKLLVNVASQHITFFDTTDLDIEKNEKFILKSKHKQKYN